MAVSSSSPRMEAPAWSQADEERFERDLVDAVEPAYRIALRLTRSGADAEDLVQEAALRAFRFRASFTPGTSLRAWFYRILVNTANTNSRRRKREAELSPLLDAHDLYLYVESRDAGIIQTPEDPLGGTIERMTAEQVGAALDALPDEFRTVCALYLVDDLSYQEIAAALDVPVGTVRSRLHRGRKLLQKRLWRLACDSGIVPDAEEDADGG